MSLFDNYDSYQHNRDVRSAERNSCPICQLPVRPTGLFFSKICPGHSTSNRNRPGRITSYQSPRIKYGFGVKGKPLETKKRKGQDDE